MDFQPELLRFLNGAPVAAPADWPARRAEILSILSDEIYGETPAAPASVTGTVTAVEEKVCSGHATLETVDIAFETEKGPFSFPMRLFLPKRETPAPLMLLINFRPDVYDMYFPAEEIIDHGFALAMIYYQDVASDDGDFTNGIAPMYTRKPGSGWGKIGMWAFSMSRALDYLLTRPEIDAGNVAAIGHSRLGKTALWCAAQDERIKYAISNDSGCAGASMERTRHEGAETLEVITRVFPFWFCENVLKHIGHTDEMPFDQHFLVAASAPRHVLIGSASKDLWADPYGEQLVCMAASPAWKLFGKAGYIGKTEPAAVGDDFGEGEIGYHLRDGVHFLGRADWLSYMRYIEARL